jgi:hypothetical protein
MLRRGDKGLPVEEMQADLAMHWSITPDGDFGLKTEAAVRNFQHQHKLTKDGIVGSYTKQQLKTAWKRSETVSPINWFSKTPYFSQRDNEHVPNGTCNVTSLAMVMAALDPSLAVGEVQLEDRLFQQLQTEEASIYFEKHYKWAIKQGFNPRNIHGMLKWLCNKNNFADLFSDSTTLDQIEEWAVEVGGPIIISGKFTAGGHIVVLCGQTYFGDLIINDPYGNWEHGYHNVQYGKEVIYNLEDVKDVWSGKFRTHRIKMRN